MTNLRDCPAAREPGDVMVEIVKRFDAAPERVFDAWLDPKMIGQWMFGKRLRDEEIVHLRTDARVGGSFSFLVTRDGQLFDHIGVYRELDRPRRLVFTWGIACIGGAESVVEINIVPSGSGSELTLTHNIPAQWAEYRERTRGGWTTMLDMLDTIFSEQSC